MSAFSTDNCTDQPDEDDAADGGRAKKVKAKPLAKSVIRVGVGYDEESLSGRRELTRGIATLDQDETIYLITHSLLQVQKRNRLKYPGTTCGNRILPVVVPSFEEMWTEDFATKKGIFGPARVAVGGATRAPSRVRKRELTDKEPVYYHSQGEGLFAEVLHILGKSVGLIVDLTAADGMVGHLALQPNRRIPYLGLTHTEEHARRLKAHLVQCVLKDFREKGHCMHKPNFVTVLEGLKGKEEEEEQGEEADKKTKKPGKGKGGPKPKGKSKSEKNKRRGKAVGKKPKKNQKETDKKKNPKSKKGSNKRKSVKKAKEEEQSEEEDSASIEAEDAEEEDEQEDEQIDEEVDSDENL